MSPSIARGAGTVAALIVGLTACAAALTLAAGLRGEVRSWLRLGLPVERRPLADALEIVVTNARVALIPLGAAVLVPLFPRLRRVADVGLVLLASVNAFRVGGALAAYGPPLAGALACHAPIELAGFSVAGGAYLASREDRTLDRRRLAGAGAVSGGLLALAALAEIAGCP
jgi:hypothetical protein